MWGGGDVPHPPGLGPVPLSPGEDTGPTRTRRQAPTPSLRQNPPLTGHGVTAASSSAFTETDGLGPRQRPAGQGADRSLLDKVVSGLRFREASATEADAALRTQHQAGPGGSAAVPRHERALRADALLRDKRRGEKIKLNGLGRFSGPAQRKPSAPAGFGHPSRGGALNGAARGVLPVARAHGPAECGASSVLRCGLCADARLLAKRSRASTASFPQRPSDRCLLALAAETPSEPFLPDLYASPRPGFSGLI